MDGIIIINKEKGYTSHDAVYKIKKMFNTKVGHTGTLDPNATGVLPILLGKGTKLSKYLIEHDKEYEVLLQLGTKTTTADEEGEEVEKKCVPEQYLQFKNIEKILKSFIGESQQVPPMYSAIKVNGKKLYEYARKGQQVEIKPRNIEIYDIELIKVNKEEKQMHFKVRCSKGTYIRTLCENIAEEMQTVGYMKELKRTKVGKFTIEQAITIEQLKEGQNIKVITIEEMFEDKESKENKVETKVFSVDEEEKKENKKVEAKEVKKETKEEKVDYSTMTVSELKKLAKEQGVSGYSTMKKDELLASLK